MQKSSLFFQFFLIILFVSNHVKAQSSRDITKNPAVKWEFKTDGPIHGSPVVSKSKIFFGSGDQSIYAADKSSGEILWKYKTDGPIYSTPALSGDKLYTTSMDGNLYVLNKASGRLIYKFKTSKDKQKDIWDYHTCSPIVHGDMVYFGDASGSFYALDKQSGEKVWEYKTDGIIHTKPIVYKENIYFGNFDGFFYALNKETGKEIWKFNTIGQRWFPKGAIQQGAAVKDGIVYFGSRDFNIYALNAETGTGMWNMYEQGSWVIATPAIKDTLLLFGTSDSHHFYAMDARYGTIIWKKKINLNVFGEAEIGDNFAYFGALNGKVYAVDLKTGETAWEFQTEESKKNWRTVFDSNNKLSDEFINQFGNDVTKFYEVIHGLGSVVSKPLLDEGVLYFTSMNGRVYAIE